MKTRFSAGLGALGLGAFLLLWEGLVRSGVLPPTLLPAPSQLPEALLREARSGFWLASVQSSLGHYLLGLVLGLGGRPVTGRGLVELVEDVVDGWVPTHVLEFRDLRTEVVRHELERELEREEALP